MPQGTLFTKDFLDEGIKEAETWRNLGSDTVEAFHARISGIFAEFPVAGEPNEATTERDLIDHVLRALGWEHFIVQQAASRRRFDVPDYLLFEGQEARRAANKESQESRRYLHGTAIVEAKRWQRPLGRGQAREPDLFDDGVPEMQMLRYLTIVETASDRRIKWGILTNGRHWRLYFQGARSRSEQFLELDLPVIAGIPGVEPDLFSPKPEERAHQLKVFFMMFHREAFLPTLDGDRTFHQFALDEGRLWEARVAEKLGDDVFERIFPELAKALAECDPEAPAPLTDAYLEDVRVSALTLLYRLLFVFYAEDRNLLPIHDRRYDGYALRRVREDVRDRTDRRDTFSGSQGRYHQTLNQLFRAIHAGDEALGLPPYNGGLFDSRQHPLLDRVNIPDARFARIVDALSRREEKGERKWISYRDLSVQHLGSIYERLLEHSLIAGKGGKIEVRPNIFARRTSGSYYTHDDLVTLIIERAVGTLLEEKWKAFGKKANELSESRERPAERLSQLCGFDPATAMLELKICDPAMGSGHFLVSLVDYLADAVLEAMDSARASVAWTTKKNPYVSPLVNRIEAIRSRILEHASEHKWTVERDHLDDRHIVRRMILKRMIYGVDKNPMAVELAKVALWLHTFTVGAPLSFLDHHLRCGDSLFGEFVRPVEDVLKERTGLFLGPSVAQAKAAAKGMSTVERLSDADIAEVKTSAATFAGIEEATGPLARFLDLFHAVRWIGPTLRVGNEDFPVDPAFRDLLDGNFGDPVAIAAGLEQPRVPRETAKSTDKKGKVDLYDKRQIFAAFERLLEHSGMLADEEHFLHWEVAFPGVWRDWESGAPQDGFDAVIGNPPWDRMKLQEVEWFAARRPEIARAQRAADRKRMIRELVESGNPLAGDYEKARDRAEAAARVAREAGQYPLLSRGDVNLYSLFVERAFRLIRKDGVVGLLVPSGIAADLGASEFFRSISTEGRLAALLDFENRRPAQKHFFPDVDSRFKFSAFIAGGQKRKFRKAECAFFLHDVTEVPTASFPLAPEDFRIVNPNTGTAPVFRTKRDAEITLGIYGRLPVLRDRSGKAGGPNRKWRDYPDSLLCRGGMKDPPVWLAKYIGMFHMTNDSHLFRTTKALEKDGFYRTALNRWKRGETEYVPLYEGKMVQAFDHRAAAVKVNPENVHRPAQPVPATPEQHADPDWLPEPQFWISASQMPWPRAKNKWVDEEIRWVIGFKHVTAPTNVRTMIAAAVPFVGCGNSLPLLVPLIPEDMPGDNEKSIEEDAARVSDAFTIFKNDASLWLANLNSFAFDFVVRQKVQGQNLNWFIIEQLPVVPEYDYDRKIGAKKASDLIRHEVLKLTYTARDMAPFAKDMGHDGPPFPWDEEERRHSRARLDAIYFMLYGIGRDDADYILGTFPIVKREDEAAHGRYLTRDLILAYMAAFEAGDPATRVAI